LEKIISSLGKNKDFHLLNFENAHFWVKEEEKSKIFHLLNFENAYFWVKEEDENLYKISYKLCKHI